MEEMNTIRIPRESISITLFEDWEILKHRVDEDDSFYDYVGHCVGAGYLFSFNDSSNRLFKKTEVGEVPIDLEDEKIIKEIDIVKGCALLNEKQLKRISVELEYWKKDYSPGEKYSLVQSKYLRQVIEIFKEWYKEKKIKFPIREQLEIVEEVKMERGRVADQTTSVRKKLNRLNLPANKREILNEKIVERIEKYVDAGKGSQEKAFVELSKKNLLGYKLSPKAIEGRYKRKSERYKKMKIPRT